MTAHRPPVGSGGEVHPAVERVRVFADEHLFPTANEVDALDVIPRSRLDRLAEEGFYGLASPTVGLQMSDVHLVNAAMAGGCLTTMLVWAQHHGTVVACSFGPEHLRSWVEPLCAGEVRSTVAFAGLLPTPPLRSRPDGESWVIDGVAPWVSGWGLVDVVHVAARAPDDDVVWLLVDAGDPGLRAVRHRLLALDASATVTLHFDGVRVGPERVTNRFPWSEWPDRDAAGLRTNGSFALGLAERCCRVMGPSALDGELRDVTDQLDVATPETLPHARAVASAFAMRAASALVVSVGSGAVDRGTTAERLVREATMLLVYGSRPSIRTSLLGVLGA